MKRGLILLSLVLMSSLVLAQNCDLEVSLLNQDPYPAVQGELVKLVFQIEGIESTECQGLEFRLIEKYPFTLDPGSEKSYKIASGTFNKDFSGTFMAPFKVRVDENALDGENPVEVKYTYGTTTFGQQIKSFDIEVQDVRADFEIFVKEYIPSTGEISFEILNIGESDIEALTVEIPAQEGLSIKGADRDIAGDLDSNEDTSVTFTISSTKEEILLNMIYSDTNNQRRTVSKLVKFNKGNFKVTEDSSGSTWKWILGIIIVGGAYYYWRRKKKQKKA